MNRPALNFGSLFQDKELIKTTGFPIHTFGNDKFGKTHKSKTLLLSQPVPAVYSFQKVGIEVTVCYKVLVKFPCVSIFPEYCKDR